MNTASSGVFGRVAAGVLVMGLVTAGALTYPEVAQGQAKTAVLSEQAQAAKGLKAQIGQTTDLKQQSELRLKLVDAYMAGGRPFEAVREIQTWLKNNADSPKREGVLLTLIAAHRLANDADAAASVSRTFVRDFPKSAQRDAVFAGLVEVARYGQTSPSSESSAIGEWLAANPKVDGAGEKMLRMARLQEQVGDVAGAVETLQGYAEKFAGSDARGADMAGWRAVGLMHDRLRKTGEAIAAGEAHLKKFAKRPGISGDWKWLGDLARGIDKKPEAIGYYRKALEADAKNRDVMPALLDAAGDKGTEADLAWVLKHAEGHFAGEPVVSDARLALLWRQSNSGKAGVFEQARAMLAGDYRLKDVAELMNRSANADSPEGRAKLIAAYEAAMKAPGRSGWGRSELALRLADVLRRDGKLDAAQAVLAKELQENPHNRKELAREYLTWKIEGQNWEIQNKKRTKLDIDEDVKKIVALVKPVAHLYELRNGLDEAVGMLHRFKQRDAALALRQQVEALGNGEVPTLVDALNREARRDVTRAMEALGALAKSHAEKPGVRWLTREAAFVLLERVKSDADKEKVLAWLRAWANAEPGNLGLNRDVGEAFRRAGKAKEAMAFFDRVMGAEVTRENAFVVGTTMGSVIDVQAYALQDLGAVEKSAALLEKIGEVMPGYLRQERYRQIAEVYGRQKEGREQQIAYYRKAVALGASNAGWEALKNLMVVLPAEEALATGEKLLADPAYDRWSPELGLIMAHKAGLDLKDLSKAAALAAEANRQRLTGFRSDYDNWNTLRELTTRALDVADPKRVSDPEKREALKAYKPLSDKEIEGLLDTAISWLGSQALHEVSREAIRRAGAQKQYARQLTIFSGILSRTRSNDGWHWDRNMDIIRDEIARGNDGVAATMLQALLKQSSQYNEASRAIARNLLINQFKKFGEDLLAVDANSPIAPLLTASSLLRLGEEKRAWAIYQENSEIFAKRIDEVPSDYVLFVANELATGSDTDRDQAEGLLRLWLARAEKSNVADDAVKAAVTLKLADVFYYGRRFDVARAEYQAVIDKYPELREAVEAQFRIGESFMYQKNFPEAEKVFEKLRKSKEADTAVRGTFMTGVLQYTQGNHDQAKDTFKQLLELSPSEDLASKALYQLALIYGDDNRFREMLDMLEAIGRIGREGKRWHTPGQTLTVMIHDPDMAIVQGASSVPVLVTTTNGDREVVTLSAGSAGKGIYLSDLPTALGSPKPGDGMLQLLGNDVISYDYPDDFKAKFKYVPPPQGNIRIASDATFKAQTVKIEEEKEETVAEKAKASAKIEREAGEAKEFRSAADFKPGNPLYVRVVDADRSLTTSVDKLEVTVRAASGDLVRAFLSEVGPDTGVFEGMVKTAERPPEAIASDAALGRPAALAADKDAATAWESQHDGAAGKWIAADLKEVLPVGRVTFASPDAKVNAPVKYSIETSVNGQLWEAAYATEEGRVAHGLSLNYGPMRHTHYAWSKMKAQAGGGKAPEDLAGYMKLAAAAVPDLDAGSVTTFAVDHETLDAEADVHMHVGYFHAPTAGTYRFSLHGTGKSGALVIDGRIIAAKKDDWGRDFVVSAELSAGWHRMAAFATFKHDPKNDKKGMTGLAYLAPGAQAKKGTNEAPSPVQTVPVATNSKDGMPALAPHAVPALPKVTSEGGKVTAELAGVNARYVRINIEKYEGDFVAVSDLSVASPEGKVYLPTAADVVTLADDEVLQVSPGDEVVVSYVDQINTRSPGEARLLSSKLKATYFNGGVGAIAYEVSSGKDGVKRTAKALYRVDPGDRIVASITDFDEDIGPEINTINFVVRTESGEELKLEATETAETTGVFTKEIETSATREAGKLLVKPGERVQIVYVDKQNTVPGSQSDRVATVEVVKPTVGQVFILPTRAEVPVVASAAAKDVKETAKGGNATVGAPVIVYLPPEAGKPSRVVLAAPLTVEVFDQDAAKDSHSTVVVNVSTSAGAKLRLPLELSDQARPGKRTTGLTAVQEGRFVGQALLVLGKPNADGKLSENVSLERARGLLGAWRYSSSDDTEGTVAAPIVPVLGSDTIQVTYEDERTPTGEPGMRAFEARMVTDALLANLSRGFVEPAVQTLHIGEKLYVRLEDGDRDATGEQDEVNVVLTSSGGEKLELKLKETLGHSGVFIGEVSTQHAEKPTPGNDTLEVNFGDALTLTYADEANATSQTPIERTLKVDIALGADAQMIAFTKQFGSEELAVETQFKLAECYFELFKSHNALKAQAEARQALEAGRAVLAQVRENHRGSNYEARVLYLLGGFHQELKEYDEALEAFSTVVRAHGNSPFAPDAQYKLAQCYEDKGEMEKACEEYVRLAYTYPENPLIAKCMVRLTSYFYNSRKYVVAANIAGQFLEQYESHEFAPQVAYQRGQAFYRAAEAAMKEEGQTNATGSTKGLKISATAAEHYLAAAKCFDTLVERYVDSDLRPEAMFWAGQCYHKGGDPVSAYRRYRRVTWDFPDSDAARYARGQLTLPEISAASKEDAK